MEKDHSRVTSSDIMINKSGTKIWMIFRTNQQAQNDMSQFRQTTHGIV